MAMVNKLAQRVGRYDLFAWYAVARLKWRYRRVPTVETPGLLFLEIDGLAEPILRAALQRGELPTLARWLRDGSHRLTPWDAGLPAQTSACQAGILHGNAWDIPAFRWYEKERGHVMRSSSPADAAVYNRRISNGRGLLQGGGVSISNNVDGDAPRSIVTMSRVTHPDPVATKVGTVVKPAVSLFLEDWASVAHALLHTGWEVLVEVAEAWRQRRQGVQPRVNRGGVYPLVRATTTGALVDVSIHTVLATMLRGVPAAYATFVSYDEVAHHSGPQSPDAMRVLRALDRKFAVLEQAARLAPRPYRLVILSDHGQSHGAPFRQRYGQTLAHVVQTLVSDRHQVAPVETGPEALGHTKALLADLSRVNNSLGRLIQRLVKNRMPGGQRDSTPQGNAGATDTEHAAASVVVCVSGNLALIYFSHLPGRLSYEEITARFPGVVEGLVAHPGIGYVLAHSHEHGPLVIGRTGRHYLTSGQIEGMDPLANFGLSAADHLRRLDAFPHTGDLVINSMYDPATGEVAAFEELVGSHGGLGGWQNQPFVLAPASCPLADAPIIGAEALHTVIAPWVQPTGPQS